MDIIALETPRNTEKHLSPPFAKEDLFIVTEYGKTPYNTACYQLRMNSPIGCLQYVISGRGTIICDDKIFTVQGGDTFLLPANTNHIYYSSTENHFERIWINFKGTLADALLTVFQLESQIVFRQTDESNLDLYNIIEPQGQIKND